jgi:low molecular weight protein-tyrosine phosphatase
MRAVLRREGLDRRVAVESAGTAGYHTGELPDLRTRSAARARGLSLESRAQQFRAQDFGRFDLVLAMDEANVRDLHSIAPDADARAKICLFRSFDPASPPGSAVPDPYHGGAQGFEQVLDLCEAACEGLLEHLRREHGL